MSQHPPRPPYKEKHPVRVSVFRPTLAEWIDPTVPTARACAGLLQYLSRWKTSDQEDLDGHRRSVPVLAEEPIREVGRSDSRTSRRHWRRQSARQVPGPLLPKCQTRPGGGNRESARAGPHSGGHWRQGQPKPSSGIQATLGESV